MERPTACRECLEQVERFSLFPCKRCGGLYCRGCYRRGPVHNPNPDHNTASPPPAAAAPPPGGGGAPCRTSPPRQTLPPCPGGGAFAVLLGARAYAGANN